MDAKHEHSQKIRINSADVWKILRGIFGPMQEDGVYKIRCNHELKNPYNDFDLVTRMTYLKVRWAGHVVCIAESTYSTNECL